MRAAMRSIAILAALASPALAGGELDIDLGLQATHTTWTDDHGGGATMAATYWFLPYLGATYIGKEQYITVDQRWCSYFSVNASGRVNLGVLRLVGTLGLVHQHEETQSQVMEQPAESLFGVGDGIRHRMGARTGGSLQWPFAHYARGDFYGALDLDATVFAEAERGPRWMMSAGLSAGFTFDFGRTQR